MPLRYIISQRISMNLTRIWAKLQPSEAVLQGGAAVIVGVGTGLGVWLFKRMIDVAHGAAFDVLGHSLSPLGAWTIALVPVIGGLLVGLIVQFFIAEERHHGVAGIMEAVALSGGRLRYQRLP